MTVTIRNKVDLVVPASVRRQAGIKVGDQVEFKVSGGVINVIPKLAAADHEYTPEERRAVDARLISAHSGPYYGPFETADEAVKFLGNEIRRRNTTRLKPTKT